MGKTIDETITTLGDFRHATRDLKDNIQLFIQDIQLGETSGPLVEVTEIQLILPKNENDTACLVLRCV
jgi:hypothetical protein